MTRVTILGNHPEGGQFSMFEYAEALRGFFAARADYTVQLVQPEPWLSRRVPKPVVRNLETVLHGIHLPPSDLLVVADQGNAFALSMARARRKILICHDLIPFHFASGRLRGWQPSLLGRQYLHWNRKSFVRADRIVCVSESTRRDVEALEPPTAAKTCVLHNYATPRHGGGAQAAKTALSELGLAERPFVLTFGKQPYKNPEASVEAFAAAMPHLPGEMLLVMISDFADKGARKAAELGCQDRVRILTNVSDAALSGLYRRARLLLFPCTYAGFGWPVLEAQEVDVPVITSPNSSLPEVAGEAALLVDPADTAALGDALVAACTDEPLRARLIEAGRTNLRRFSKEAWEAGLSRILVEMGLPA